MQAAAKSAPVLFLFPHAELNHFFNSVWITRICATISDNLIAQKEICKRCHDSK